MSKPPWIKTVTVASVKGDVEVDATDVDGFLTAYEIDPNTFWRADQGHIMNVLDELIVRLSFRDQQLISANETIVALAKNVHEMREALRDEVGDDTPTSARSESPGSSDASS